jgi:hypothetical protein
MTTRETRKIVQQVTTNSIAPGYMSGFGNDHETEALKNVIMASMQNNCPGPHLRNIRQNAHGVTAFVHQLNIQPDIRRSKCLIGKLRPASITM